MDTKLDIELYDRGNDLLEVVATDAETGETVSAFGWVSATQRHWPADLYQEVTTEDGEKHVQLGSKGKPRKMTNDELREYALALLAEQHPAVQSGKAPKAFATFKV